MKQLFTFSILFLIAFNLKAQTGTYNSLLQKYVDKKGNVDYKNLKKEETKLTEYLSFLAKTTPQKSWSNNKTKAFWINAYNAYTLKIILDNYPTKSIKDINGPWRKKIVTIGNDQLSLGEIEHSILRKMNEPRIHFAINCASISCPNLLNEAFTASKIEAQLERTTKAFINSDKNKISASNVKISEIFESALFSKKRFKALGFTAVTAATSNGKSVTDSVAASQDHSGQ